MANRSELFCECYKVDRHRKCWAKIKLLETEEEWLYDHTENRIVIVDGCVYLPTLIAEETDYFRIGRARMYDENDVKAAIELYESKLKEDMAKYRSDPYELRCECNLGGCEKSVMPTALEWAMYKSVCDHNEEFEEFYLILDECDCHEHLEEGEAVITAGRFTFVTDTTRCDLYDRATDDEDEDEDNDEDDNETIVCMCGVDACSVDYAEIDSDDLNEMAANFESWHQSTISTHCPLYPLITSGIVARADDWVVVEDGDLGQAQDRYAILEGRV